MAAIIAVVDDDPSVCRGLARLLRSAGYSVQSHASAGECLRSGSAGVRCWIIDVHMAGMNGIALAGRLRDAGSCAPIIFITALDDDATHDALKAMDHPLCLRKPVQSELLLGAIVRAIGEPV